MGDRYYPPPVTASEVRRNRPLRKGTWTSEEDALLVAYLAKHGEGNWKRVQNFAGLNRSAKSCRLRWTNHLRPDLKKGPFTQEEEMLVVQLHAQHGNKWALIASELPGRTDNEIKNFWNCLVRRTMREKQREFLPLVPLERQSFPQNPPQVHEGEATWSSSGDSNGGPRPGLGSLYNMGISNVHGPGDIQMIMKDSLLFTARRELPHDSDSFSTSSLAQLQHINSSTEMVYSMRGSAQGMYVNGSRTCVHGNDDVVHLRSLNNVDGSTHGISINDSSVVQSVFFRQLPQESREMMQYFDANQCCMTHNQMRVTQLESYSPNPGSLNQFVSGNLKQASPGPCYADPSLSSGSRLPTVMANAVPNSVIPNWTSPSLELELYSSQWPQIGAEPKSSWVTLHGQVFSSF